MANITIGGGASAFKDAIPSALQFGSWDKYQWFQQGGQGFNINYQNFYNNPVYFHHIHDTANKKFFALPQGMGNKNNRKYDEQCPIGVYKYDHQTDTCVFIELDKDDVYANRGRFDTSQNYSYENIVFDESSGKLFWFCFGDKTLWEVDQGTGELARKTDCILVNTVQSVVACNGYLYVLDSGKGFARYNITSDSWESLASMTGNHSLSQNYIRLLSDGSNWIVFVPYQAMSNTSYPLMKYSISGDTWTAATTSSAPPQSNYYISEIFNGYVYICYLANTNNYNQIWKYNLANNSWTFSPFNLRDEGMSGGGMYGLFRANNKLYWIGSQQVLDYNESTNMQKYGIWEMDTSENFTLKPDKYLPVQVGQWSYAREAGYERCQMPMSKSCGRYTFFCGFHSYARGFRRFPYVDPIGKTVEWVDTPKEANREREWNGWAGVVKNGKLYLLDPVTLDLWECAIGSWTWTKKDNLFDRLGGKMPYSCSGSQWLYGGGLAHISGMTPYQLVGGLFTVKEDDNIYLMSPRSGGSHNVYTYKFDVTANEWSTLNSSGQMPNSYLANNESNNSYAYRKNHLITSNEASSWLLLTAYCYNSSNGYHTQKYYAFNPVDGSFEEMVGYQHTSTWYGVYGFTLEGQPIWHTSTGNSKLYFNDMATMAYDVINKYLEQFLDDQNKYIWMRQNTGANSTGIFHIDPDNFEKSFMLRVYSNSTEERSSKFGVFSNRSTRKKAVICSVGLERKF